MNYTKSAIVYQGGKNKLLHQLLILFPTHFDNYIDLFCGSGSVAINTKANRHYLNDKNKEVVLLLNYLYTNSIDEIITNIYKTMLDHGLDNNNVRAYLKFRDYYNETRNIDDLLVLVYHSFSNGMRFNKEGMFNLPFGNRSFNKQKEIKLITFVSKLQEIKQLHLYTQDCGKFLDALYPTASSNTFIYCDPPYFNSNALYNNSWNTVMQQLMLDKLALLMAKGVKIGITDFIYNKGHNDMLLDFVNKYDLQIHSIDSNYNNCYYNKKDTLSTSREVYVCNY